MSNCKLGIHEEISRVNTGNSYLEGSCSLIIMKKRFAISVPINDKTTSIPLKVLLEFSSPSVLAKSV